MLEDGNKNEGLRHFELAVAATGPNKEGFNNLGSACAEHGYLEEAANFYRRSLTIDPNYDLGLRNLSRAYAALGRHAEAYELIDRLVATGKARSDDIRLGADCLVKVGRVDDAIDALLDLTRKHPNDPQTYRALGFIYLNEKSASEVATRYFTTSLGLQPNQPELETILRRMETPPSEPEMAIPELPEIPSVNSLAPKALRPTVPRLRG